MQCKICGIVFSSQMLLDKHADAHFHTKRMQIFQEVLKDFQTKKPQLSQTLQTLIDTHIIPKIMKSSQLKNQFVAEQKRLDNIKKNSQAVVAEAKAKVKSK